MKTIVCILSLVIVPSTGVTTNAGGGAGIKQLVGHEDTAPAASNDWKIFSPWPAILILGLGGLAFMAYRSFRHKKLIPGAQSNGLAHERPAALTSTTALQLETSDRGDARVPQSGPPLELAEEAGKK